MKKALLILGLVLAVTLAMVLVACGGGGATSTSAPPTTATTGGTATSAGPETTTAATTPAGTGKEKVTVGYVDAFTGVFAPGPMVFGTFWFEALIAEYNAAGGLYVPEEGKKLPIELVKYDSASDAETLIRLTEKAMSEDKVDLMIAPWGTSQNFAVLSLYEKYGYPLIAHSMGSGQIVELIQSGATKWCFPVLCQPPFVAKYVADFIQKNGAGSKIGIIGVNDLHGIEFTGRVQSELAARGMDIVVGPELYPLNVTDLSPIVKELKEAGVDTLWASTYPADGTLLVKQMMELGYSPKIMFMGPGSQYPLVMIPAFGTEAVKGIMEYHGFEVDFTSTPKLQALADVYKAAAGGWPGSNTIAAYVGAEIMFKAVEQVGLDREKVRELLKTGTIETVLGPAKWDWDNVYLDVPGAGFISQWQGGEMMKVVWPEDRATAPWMPKAAWPAT